MTLLKAILEHLRLENEPLSAFREQIKKLTDKDRADLTQWFSEMGVEIEPAQS